MIRETIEKLLKTLIENPEKLEDVVNSISADNGKDIAKEVRKYTLLKEKYEDYDELKAKLEEFENKSSGDSDKLEKAIKKAEDREKEINLKMNHLKVREIFVSANIDPLKYQSIIDGIVGEDSDKTETLANSLVEQLNQVVSDTEARIKEELLAGGEPGPQGTGATEPSQGALFAQLINAENGIVEGV